MKKPPAFFHLAQSSAQRNKWVALRVRAFYFQAKVVMPIW